MIIFLFNDLYRLILLNLLQQHTCIVDDGKVRILVALFRLLEGHRLAKMVGHQLLLERLVRRLREERLLLQDGEQAHWFFEHVDTFLEVHAEINHGPFNA
jgi:hypothetical protein